MTSYFIDNLFFPKLNNINNVIIIGNYNDGNLGDELMLSVITNLINIYYNNPNIYIPIKKQLPKNYFDNRIHSKNVYSVNYLESLKKLFDSDLIIFGGGSIFSKDASIPFYFILLIALVKKNLFKSHYFFYSIGFSKSTPKLLRLISKYTLNGADGIFVRDYFSNIRLIKDLKIDNKKITKIEDAGFYYEDNNNEIVASDTTINIGISLTYIDDNKEVFIKNILKFINKIVETDDCNIFLFPFCLGLSSKRSDLTLCIDILNSLEDRYKKNIIVVPISNIKEMLSIFKRLNYVICMRYHCAVLAKKYGIPSIVISSEEKFDSFCFEYKCEKINYSVLSAELLETKLEKLKKEHNDNN